MPGAQMEFLTIAQAAGELQCSRKTVQRAIDRGALKAFNIAERPTWRIRRADFDAWLEARANPTPRPPKVGTAEPIQPDRVGPPRRRALARGRGDGALVVRPGMGRKDR